MEDALQRHQEELLQLAYNICRWHHERYDGGGYPDGLRGDEIPIEAQVVALADVYDALTSVRVYKPAYPHEQPMEMILGGECGAFNPLLAAVPVQGGAPPGGGAEAALPGRYRPKQSIQELSSQMMAGGPSLQPHPDAAGAGADQVPVFCLYVQRDTVRVQLRHQICSRCRNGARRQLACAMLIEHPANDAAAGGRLLTQGLPGPAGRAARRHARLPDRRCGILLPARTRGKTAGTRRSPGRSGRMRRAARWMGVIGKFVDVHEETAAAADLTTAGRAGLADR